MKLSVIIPALNEQERIEACLASVTAGDSKPGSIAAEVIVVDGGSQDATVRLARGSGAEVIGSRRGRARQMNAGAAIATGDTLLFLHADTQLPPGYREEIQLVRAHGADFGAFPLAIDAGGAVYRLIESAANFRSRRFGLPYGDQAPFFSRRAFDDLGGFPELEAMEDYELHRRAAKRFGRPPLAKRPVTTSARRWRERGPLWLTSVHAACIVAYGCGVSTTRIARWRDGPSWGRGR